MSTHTSNFSAIETRLMAYHKNKPAKKTKRRTRLEKAVALATANVKEHSNNIP